MNKNMFQHKIDGLRSEIERHNRLYFVEDDPEIGDSEYDELMRELAQIEKRQVPRILTHTKLAGGGAQAFRDTYFIKCLSVRRPSGTHVFMHRSATQVRRYT